MFGGLRSLGRIGSAGTNNGVIQFLAAIIMFLALAWAFLHPAQADDLSPDSGATSTPAPSVSVPTDYPPIVIEP